MRKNLSVRRSVARTAGAEEGLLPNEIWSRIPPLLLTAWEMNQRGSRMKSGAERAG
jgi:hypothetical protein